MLGWPCRWAIPRCIGAYKLYVAEKFLSRRVSRRIPRAARQTDFGNLPNAQTAGPVFLRSRGCCARHGRTSPPWRPLGQNGQKGIHLQTVRDNRRCSQQMAETNSLSRKGLHGASFRERYKRSSAHWFHVEEALRGLTKCQIPAKSLAFC